MYIRSIKIYPRNERNAYSNIEKAGFDKFCYKKNIKMLLKPNKTIYSIFALESKKLENKNSKDHNDAIKSINSRIKLLFE